MGVRFCVASCLCHVFGPLFLPRFVLPRLVKRSGQPGSRRPWGAGPAASKGERDEEAA